MDDLKHLLGAYFYELWDEHEYDSWHAAVDDFIRRSPTRAGHVPSEIDELLATISSDDLLSRELSHMGCSYDPAEGYRAWLQAIRDRILSADQATS